ncbi:MAG: DUF2630 family protein [Candidatus Nanopelagicales bacterium]|jgi:hypothetical protein
MDALHQQIHDLVETEQRLRAGEMDDEARAEIERIELQLDQIWDLLRQRNARKEFGQDPDAAHARPISEVESYLQ